MGSRVETVGALVRSGLLAPVRPDRFVKMISAFRRWGPTAASAVGAAAARHPQRTAIIDDRGSIDWGTLDARTDAIAHGLISRGAGADGTVGLLCRNGRSFVEVLVAAAKAGADVVLLNTGFAGPQLAEVSRREGVTLLVHDASFAAVVADSGLADELTVLSAPTDLDGLASSAPGGPPPAPERAGGVTILSSGTTGTPKGAHRSPEHTASKGNASQVGLLTRVPLKAASPTLISAPLFHTWGLSGFLLAAVMGSPMVLRERFDPADVLATIEREQVDTLIGVPVMLHRILALPDAQRVTHDTSSLRVVFLSGSALPGDLATRWMDEFGDNLYNLYGSTEVAAVAVAGPSDLRAAPDSAGPVLSSVEVRLLDDADQEVPEGATGRIFVKSGMLFEGYTGGGTKAVVDGHMSTGDLGRIDADGRLHVEGREDDMLITGGENVQPDEIEHVMTLHPGVHEAAVVGVPDDDLGQRLVAFVAPAADLDAPPTEDEMRAWVRERLAGYKVPKEIRFIDRLPRNPTGKVVRRALLDEAAVTPLED
jgi:acyl-CoA synthetase (AMP-forming)/AMP-acid ligase II